MFAGPNGSGKSTLKSVLPRPLLGVYLNPDEIEAGIRRDGFLRVADFGAATTAGEIRQFFATAPLLVGAGLGDAARQLVFAGDRLEFDRAVVNSYFASVAADFLQRKLMERQATFTLETVMSHPSKVELLRAAQRAGYRTYLYFIATDDPEINRSRVRNRVRAGGHAVPEDRIASRYDRSLGLLMDAIACTNRAYVFDNSGDGQERTWLAEITDGRLLELKTDRVPAWFRRSVLDKISPSA